MAEISFSFAELFQKAFGYKTRAFEPKMTLIAGNEDKENPQRKKIGAYGSEYYANALGQEYYMPVKIIYVEDRDKGADTVLPDQRGTVTGSSVSKKVEIYLPFPVISISSKKRIVKTEMTERVGTVKEFISVEDYDIVVRGMAVSISNEFPESDVAALRSLYEINKPVSIKCPLTDIFLLRHNRTGSDKVVITELKFPNNSKSGIKHVCPYELHMVSDAPFSLIEIDKEK